MYTRRGWSYSSPLLSPTLSRRRRRGISIGSLAGFVRLGPLPLAVAVVAGAGWYHFLFGGFVVQGEVRDAVSGLPIAGAQVWSDSHHATAEADGAFSLAGIKPPEAVTVGAPGYERAQARLVRPDERLLLRLQPVTFEVRVLDAESGAPLATAAVSAEGRALTDLGNGRFRLSPARTGDRIRVQVPGYQPQEAAYTGEAQDLLEIKLQPSLEGRVTNAQTGQGVAGVRLFVDGSTITTRPDGTYQLPTRPRNGRVTILEPGFWKAEVDLSGRRSLDVQLRPLEAKALYLTYFAIGDAGYRKRMYELLDTTELNAVVIDVKGDPGYLAYRSRVPLAEAIGANAHPTIGDLDALLKSLNDRGVYTIARIVVFKDDLLGRHGHKAGLDVAIKDRRTGKPWIDGEDLAWVDAFQPAAWDYNIALAREAIERGFHEVQFDYIRFPTDPAAGNSIDNAVYSKPFTELNRVDALKTFLSRARQAVNEAGGFLGIDTFGYSTWWENDGGIGQHLDALADHVDYLCPMVYPSTYDSGLPGSYLYPAVVQKPYEVLYESLKNAQKKIAGKRVVIRPWLQYFDDYPWATGFRYDAPQVQAQKKAVVDSGSLGWMLWDPTNEYKRGGLAPKG